MGDRGRRWRATGRRSIIPAVTDNRRQAYIRAIGTAVPRFRAPQAEVAAWAKRVAIEQTGPVVPDSRDARWAQAAIERVYRSSAIQSRSSVVPDYVAEPADFTFYPPTWSLSPAPTTAERMELYRREAPPLAFNAARACFDRAPEVLRSDVTHLIVVTCTGFFAPGIDTLLAKDLDLRPDVERTVVGFMGCYAAFPALRAAAAACASRDDAVVLVVCVELCSIHFQNELTMDNVIANCLFSDGAAAALVTSERPPATRPAFRIVDSYSRIEEDTETQMTWTVIDTGFQMTLSAEVPATLERGIAPFAEELLSRNRLTMADVRFWAVHPGGRRIVDTVRDRLDLTEADVAGSYDVLARFGNMSSPTIRFVLDATLGTSREAGDLGVALAFGPGLTLESMLLESV